MLKYHCLSCVVDLLYFVVVGVSLSANFNLPVFGDVRMCSFVLYLVVGLCLCVCVFVDVLCFCLWVIDVFVF